MPPAPGPSEWERRLTAFPASFERSTGRRGGPASLRSSPGSPRGRRAAGAAAGRPRPAKKHSPQQSGSNPQRERGRAFTKKCSPSRRGLSVSTPTTLTVKEFTGPLTAPREIAARSHGPRPFDELPLRQGRPRRRGRAAACSRRGEAGGRPMRFPSRRARSSPAFVRSMSRVRSCSATQPKMATSSGRTGPLVSSQPSRTDRTGTPSRSQLQDRVDGAGHRAVEPVERPDGDGLDAAGAHVGHHPVEDGTRLGGATRPPRRRRARTREREQAGSPRRPGSRRSAGRWTLGGKARRVSRVASSPCPAPAWRRGATLRDSSGASLPRRRLRPGCRILPRRRSRWRSPR